MSRVSTFALLVMLATSASQAFADTVVLVAKSAAIAPTKANGMPWDFPLWGKKALPDPYVKLWVYDKDGAHADYGETPVAWDTLSPSWNIDIAKVKVGQRVWIEIWDKDIKYDDLIGRHIVTITNGMVERGTLQLAFDQVHDLQFELRAETRAKVVDRVALQQPFPGPHSANELSRTKGRELAVVLMHGLDLRDDGSWAGEPRFVDWQGSTSPLVKALSPHADIFSISYAQTTAVEEVASFPELREAIGKIKRLGYGQVVLLAHSAGGVLARHFVEEHPQAGVTRVIQIATPNGGANLAAWAVALRQVPKEQAAFVQSLAPAYREQLLNSRQHRTIPTSIEFITVVTCTAPNGKGDGAVNRRRQWPSDLQNQGIPCVDIQGTHMDVMADEKCLDVYCELIGQSHPRSK